MDTRRVLTSATLVLGGIVVLLEALAGGRAVDHPAVLLLFALAAFAAGAVAPVAWSALTVPTTAAALSGANQVALPGEHHPVNDLVFFLVIVGGPALAGAASMASRRQVRELADLTARLTDQRDTAVRAARLQERNRIEAQVHREISEQFAAVALCAEGAGRSDSAAAVERALAEIEGTARDSLDRLRATLGTLREVSVPAAAPPPPPPNRSRPGWVDVAAASACGVALAVESVVSGSSQGPAWANVLAGLLVPAPLAWRRSHPVTAAATSLAAATAMSTALTPYPLMVTSLAPLLLAAFGVGAHSRRWPLGALVVGAGVVANHVVSPSGTRDPGALMATLTVTALAGAAGLVAAGSHRRATLLREGLLELERHREIAVGLATAEQRARTAQDLHDTVAHAMTVVCVQASAGRRTGAAEVLPTILATARSGLAELRSGLDQLDLPVAEALHAHAHRLGLRPTIDVDVEQLDPAVAELAFRTVRETMVNASRYAPGARVTVRVSQADGQLELFVADDGGGGDFSHGSGSGLRGLADQFAAAGGRLRWGPADRGFEVRGRLPLLQAVPT